MRRSRRVVVLTVVAIACGALIVGTALLGLRQPDQSLSELTNRVIPASSALKGVAGESATAQRLYIESLDQHSAERAGLIADSQTAGSRRSTSWREYRSLAYDSPEERRLQHQYVELNLESNTAGAVAFGLVDSSDRAAFDTALVYERELFEQALALVQKIDANFYVPRGEALLHQTRGGLSDTQTWILVVFGIVLAGGIVNALVLLRGALIEERVNRKRERERGVVERRANLETQLQRGLEMEPNEESTYEVIEAALGGVRTEHPVELLVADASRAHFRQVLSTDAEAMGPGCPVPSPAECPAAASGQTRIFLSARRLDACPFLRNREGDPCSAACVPVSIVGTATAVIHTTGPDNEPPEAEQLTELELVARKAGDRIGYLRVLARTETQARIDVLTGLFNRRSLEQQTREVIDKGEQFVVAFADLDHFKNLNDEFGHETGDRALRLFGRVLRDSVRPSDIPSRYGGEEFVVVLPDCQLADARIVADRVRERLTSAIHASTVPAFTVSIGLAASEPPETLSETVARADAALLHAKGAGRDRVVMWNEMLAPEPAPPVEVAIPVSES
jgi:diguanylate cyclase (GGDEF)-like protein